MQYPGAQGRIRTSVARKERQIYSLLPLTTRPPVRNLARRRTVERRPPWGGLSHSAEHAHERENKDARGGSLRAQRLFTFLSMECVLGKLIVLQPPGPPLDC